MADQVVWFEVVGKDGNALRSFYSDLFGWQFSEPGEMDYGMTEGANGGIGGGVGSAPEGQGHLTFYVGVDDPQAALDKAVELGGTQVMGVTEIPDMVTFALFNDPEGHLVGIVKNRSEQGLTRYDERIGRLREAAFPGRPAPPGMEPYLDKVRHHAYRVTDDDVDALREAHTEDKIFEATVSVAVAAGFERLDAALGALELAR